ncbi:MAG: hypothetical protein SGI74_02300 [Oligoflexia bacterium]|nr:hypothetical protein [Oligoflexia bacterium]
MSEVKEKKEKTKIKTEKAKQWKVGITEQGWKILEKFVVDVNKTSKRKIRVPEVLEFAVEKLVVRDIPKVQERSYTADDKMEVMFDEYNARNPEKPMSRDEFKAAMITAFEKQVLSKLAKAQKLELDVQPADE